MEKTRAIEYLGDRDKRIQPDMQRRVFVKNEAFGGRRVILEQHPSVIRDCASKPGAFRFAEDIEKRIAVQEVLDIVAQDVEGFAALLAPALKPLLETKKRNGHKAQE